MSASDSVNLIAVDRRLRESAVVALVALVALVAALALALLSASSAMAAKKEITGKLSKPGYTVIALADSGVADTDLASNGKFEVKPPAKKVTLHLRAPDGTYGGPIVVGKKEKGKVAVVGVWKGAKLGNVKIKAAAGYARPKQKLAERWLDTKRTGTAKKGVPIGARNFGRVAVAKLKGPASDIDLDGVPTPLDVDDDGDLILDDADGNNAGTARAAQTQINPLAAFTSMYLAGHTGTRLNPGEPVNVNAPGLSDADIGATLRSYGILQIGTPPLTSAELDCGRLVYCSAGGTGKRVPSGDPGMPTDPPPEPFPACCDPDGDGLGSLGPGQGSPGLGLLLLHGAGPDQIRGGDLLIVRGPAPVGPEVESVGTLGSVVATVPAIASYTDELGVTRSISYPMTPGSPPLRVVDGPDAGSDVSVRLTLWRPQRRALPTEASTRGWVDMGNLVQLAHTRLGNSDSFCPQDSYSQPEGGLVPSTQILPGLPPALAFTFLDSAPDRPASRDNTFSYTLNLSRCLSFRGHSFEPGEENDLYFSSQFPVAPNEPPISGTLSGYRIYHQP